MDFARAALTRARGKIKKAVGPTKKKPAWAGFFSPRASPSRHGLENWSIIAFFQKFLGQGDMMRPQDLIKNPPAGDTDSLVHECYGLADQYVSRRLKDGLAQGKAAFESCDSFGFAVALTLKEFKSRLRKNFGERGQIHAVDENELVLEFDGCCATARMAQKPKYCAARVKVWAPSEQASKNFEREFLQAFEGCVLQGTLFGVHWAYMGARGLDDVYIEEIFEDDLLEEAYPCLKEFGGVQGFVDQFLDSEEAVLILQGPPGAGKTRLVRKILADMSRRESNAGGGGYDAKATALYTGDEKTLESDEVFARFVVGEERAFVVEDADHMLRPRADGNDNLHRFLAVADGIVRAGGRKVMFSTNLPNVADIDEALARPGRCFARVVFKDLSPAEAKALADRLCPGLGSQDELWSGKAFSVAQVYAKAGRSKKRQVVA